MAQLHLLVAGVGLIGNEFLKQVTDNSNVAGVAKVTIIGVANSKAYVIDKNGLDGTTVKNKLAEEAPKFTSADPFCILKFVKEGAKLGLLNTVFVDLTASDVVTPAYELALRCNMHVATANKKVNSGPIEIRKTVLGLAHQPFGPRFRYEANVGAGLPIIRPLIDMVNTGDKVIAIEAILSGTLSYLFNSLSKETPFSAVVKKAKELGFTEPDPRDDLSGSDVARKIVILTRESGYDVCLDDVVIESFLPESCISAASVPDFFTALETDFDSVIETRRANAAANGEVLRFMASLDTSQSNKAVMTLSLKNIPMSHPAASVAGSENICILTTQRYKEMPCVIKGPGAGAAVCTC